MKRTGVLITLLTVGLLGLLGTAPSQARTSIDAVASALRSNPVYNDPAAENAESARAVTDPSVDPARKALPAMRA